MTHKCFLHNVRSLKTITASTNKLNDYKNNILIHKPLCYAMVETWLDHTIQDTEIAVPGYNTFRKDRVGRGGGLLFVISDSYRSNRRIDLETSSTQYNEILVCEVTFSINCTWVFILFYRPPSADANFLLNLNTVHLLGSFGV